MNKAISVPRVLTYSSDNSNFEYELFKSLSNEFDKIEFSFTKNSVIDSFGLVLISMMLDEFRKDKTVEVKGEFPENIHKKFFVDNTEDFEFSKMNVIKFSNTSMLEDILKISLTPIRRLDNDKLHMIVLNYVSELVNNALVHSKSESGFYYCFNYNEKTNEIIFAIGDKGTGFLEPMLDSDLLITEEHEAVAAALKDGHKNTLKRLKNFLPEVSGTLKIISNDGEVFSDGDEIHSSSRIKLFSGSIVTFRINILPFLRDFSNL